VTSAWFSRAEAAEGRATYRTRQRRSPVSTETDCWHWRLWMRAKPKPKPPLPAAAAAYVDREPHLHQVWSFDLPLCRTSSSETRVVLPASNDLSCSSVVHTYSSPPSRLLIRTQQPVSCPLYSRKHTTFHQTTENCKLKKTINNYILITRVMYIQTYVKFFLSIAVQCVSMVHK